MATSVKKEVAIETREPLMLTVEEFYLVAIRLSADERGLVFYTLYVNDDQPIAAGGHPIVFFRRRSAASALMQSDFSIHNDKQIPKVVHCTFELGKAIATLSDANIPRLANDDLVNCLNLLLDCARILVTPLPEHDKNMISELADFLTFSRVIDKFLANSAYLRSDVVATIQRWIGTLASEVVVCK